MPRRVDPEAAWQLMVDAGVTPQEPYPGNGPWRCICNSCGAEVFPRHYTVKKGIGGCSECAKKVKVAKNAQRGLKATEARLAKFGFEAASPVINARTSSRVRCTSCGTISSRYLGGIDKPCPCSREQKKANPAQSLQARFPEVAKGWDSSKNSMRPNEVSAGSKKKYWFVCTAGHSYKQGVASQVRYNGGCPVCSGRRIVPGVNDLASLSTSLRDEWHPSKNSLDPSTISGGYNRKVWWLGTCGHEWEASPNKRLYGGQGCPVCQNLKLVVGVNDLATTHPEIAAEWHPKKNDKSPEDYVWGTHIKAWWKCQKCGQEWESAIVSRQRTGCPRCAGYGFDQTAEAYLYLLRKENEGLQQFGITNYPERRLKEHKKNGWEVVDVVGPADGYWVVSTETQLGNFFREKDLLLPRNYADKFDGYTESWVSSELSFSSVSELLTALRDWEP